jgi:hypothetical protein
MVTIDNFFQNTRVSFYELKSMPEGFEKFFTSESGSKYYKNSNETEVIRVSDHWGMMKDCFWLIAGESQKAGDQRIGWSSLESFEVRKDNQWKTMKDLYDLLPKSIEIDLVTKKKCWAVINGWDVVEAFQAQDSKSECNCRLGWNIKDSKSGEYVFPQNIKIDGEDEYTLSINEGAKRNIILPCYHDRRETFIFACLLTKSTKKWLINEECLYSQDFPDILRKSGVDFELVDDYFVFKLKDEIIKVKFNEAIDSQGTILDFVNSIEFN